MLRRTAQRYAGLHLVTSKVGDDVAAHLGPHDAFFLRHVGGAGRSSQYFGWPGLAFADAAAVVDSLPPPLRCAHTVFGRPGVPVDIALDIDAPMDCAAPEAQRRVCTELAAAACAALDRHAAASGERVVRRAVLRSPTPGKASLHIHAQLDGAVFADYVALREWLRPLCRAVPSLDVGIFRPLGSLRMHGCTKQDGTSRLELLPGAATDPVAVNAGCLIGFDVPAGAAPPSRDLTLLSFVVVDAARLAAGARVLREPGPKALSAQAPALKAATPATTTTTTTTAAAGAATPATPAAARLVAELEALPSGFLHGSLRHAGQLGRLLSLAASSAVETAGPGAARIRAAFVAAVSRPDAGLAPALDADRVGALWDSFDARPDPTLDCRAAASASAAIAALRTGAAAAAMSPLLNPPQFGAVHALNVLAFLEAALPMLPAGHSDEYPQWITMGLQLKALSADAAMRRAHPGADVPTLLLRLWTDFSRRSSKFEEGVCEKQWAKLRVRPTSDNRSRVAITAGYVTRLLPRGVPAEPAHRSLADVAARLAAAAPARVATPVAVLPAGAVRAISALPRVQQPKWLLDELGTTSAASRQ